MVLIVPRSARLLWEIIIIVRVIRYEARDSFFRRYGHVFPPAQNVIKPIDGFVIPSKWPDKVDGHGQTEKVSDDKVC